MQMLAICQNKTATERYSPGVANGALYTMKFNAAFKGYTLLELLVVLSLLGLITAIALPNLVTLSERVSARLRLEDIITDINGIGFIAYQSSHAYQLITTHNAVDVEVIKSNTLPVVYPLDLPQGWSVSVDRPILYRANGACSGGVLRLHYLDDVILNEALEAPFCQIKES